MIKPLRVIEFFGGIGAPRKALERLGVPFEILDYVEINPDVVKAYNAMYDERFNPQDITNWRKLYRDVDIIIHGSPCQDFSIAGSGLGGNKGSGTRSSLMFETIKKVKKLKPRCVIWENVPNVLNSNNIATFNRYKKEMNELGYNSIHWVLDAKNYGDCQERKRLFCVSLLKGIKKPALPKENRNTISLFSILDKKVDDSYFIPKSHVDWFKNNNAIVEPSQFRNELICVGKFDGFGTPYKYNLSQSVYSPFGVSPTLKQNSIQQAKKLFIEGRIRRMTPKEYFKIMGFEEKSYYAAKEAVGHYGKLYCMAGNSMCIGTIQAVIQAVLEVLGYES